MLPCLNDKYGETDNGFKLLNRFVTSFVGFCVPMCVFLISSLLLIVPGDTHTYIYIRRYDN